MVYISFKVVTTSLEFIFLSVDQVFGNLFAIFVNVIVDVDNFLFEYKLCIFIVDWVVLCPYFNFISSNLHNDIRFEHHLENSEFRIILLISLITFVVFNVFEELNIPFGKLNWLCQFLFDVLEQYTSLITSFLLKPERWITDPPHNILLELSSLFVVIAVALLHQLLVLQGFKVAQVQLECIRILLLLFFGFVEKVLSKLS